MAKLKKIAYFFTEDEYGNKYILGENPNSLIKFLKDNDPCICGIEYMTKKQFNKLSEYKGD